MRKYGLEFPSKYTRNSKILESRCRSVLPWRKHTRLCTPLSWNPTPSLIPLAGVSDSDRVVFGAKTLSFCSLTFDRVAIPPGWLPLLYHLCLHLHLFSLSFLSSLFVEALTRMRREPFKCLAMLHGASPLHRGSTYLDNLSQEVQRH